jgi:hypothetical protein
LSGPALALRKPDVVAAGSSSGNKTRDHAAILEPQNLRDLSLRQAVDPKGRDLLKKKVSLVGGTLPALRDGRFGNRSLVKAALS